jgi:hypothetical protein
VAEFVRIFPEDGSPAEAIDPAAAEPMRLEFPAGPALASHRVLAGAPGAALELAAVVAIGLAIAWAAGTPLLTTCGVTALLYYPLATTATGRTLSITRMRWLVGRGAPGPIEPGAEAQPLYLVSRTATSLPVSSAPRVEDVSAPHTAAG